MKKSLPLFLVVVLVACQQGTPPEPPTAITPEVVVPDFRDVARDNKLRDAVIAKCNESGTQKAKEENPWCETLTKAHLCLMDMKQPHCQK